MKDIPCWIICAWGGLVAASLWNVSTTIEKIYNILKNGKNIE